MLKPLVSKFRSALSPRLKDIAEKQVPAKLEPIVELPDRPYPPPGAVDGRQAGKHADTRTGTDTAALTLQQVWPREAATGAPNLISRSRFYPHSDITSTSSLTVGNQYLPVSF